MILLYGYMCSGNTWMCSILDHLQVKFRQSNFLLDVDLGFQLPSPLHSFHKTSNISKKDLYFSSKSGKLIYLWRDPFDVFASRIKKTIERKINLKNRLKYGPTHIINHHLSAVHLANQHSNFKLIKYENLRGENGIEEFKKIYPEITKDVWEHFSYENVKMRALTNSAFEDQYNFIKRKKLHGGLVGHGKLWLKPCQIKRMQKIIEEVDYWNKMKQIKDF